MPTLTRVYIRIQDIATGDYINVDDCPLARAINRKLNPVFRAEVGCYGGFGIRVNCERRIMVESYLKCPDWDANVFYRLRKEKIGAIRYFYIPPEFLKT